MTYSPLPKWTILDTNGDPVVAGTLYFYEAGTTTPKNVYSDAGRTTSAGAELTTDSLGQVGPVYLDTAAATKAVCKDSDDVTLWTVDNLTAPSGTSVTVSSVPRSVSPLDYGAVGDGAADESTEVQQALDAGAGFVDLGGKTYRCDSGLTLPAGTRLINGALDFSQMGSGTACLSATGSLGSAIFATSDIDGGDSTIRLSSTAGLSSGKWIKVSSNATWGAVGSTKDGELTRIYSVFSGTVLWLDGLAIDGYTVANSAKVEQLTTVANIAIEDVRITGTTLVSIPVLGFTYCEKVSLRNVSVTSYSFSAVSFTSCVDCSVDACNFFGSNAGTAVVIDGTSQRITITDSKMSVCLIGVTVGRATDGVCRFVSLAQCSISAGSLTGSTGVKFDQDSQFCSVSSSFIRGGRTTTGNVYGVVDYGNANRVTDCDIASVEDACILSETRVSKAPSFNATDVSPAFKYSGNTMQSLDDAIVIAPYSGVALTGGVITHNRIQYAAVNAIEMQSVAAISGITIDSNVMGEVGRGLYLYGASAFNQILFSNNTVVSGSELANLDIDASSSHIEILHNSLTRKTGLSGIMIDVDVATLVNMIGLYINGNTLVTGSGGGIAHAIRLTSTDAGRLSLFSVDNNDIYITSHNTGEAAIELTDVRQGSVCGNSIDGTATKYGILLQSASATVSATVDEVSIARNQISMTGIGGIGEKGIYVNASGSSDIEHVSVHGNTIHCGATNIDEAIRVYAATGQVVDNVSIDGNVIYAEEAACEGIVLESVDADGILDSSVTNNTVNTFATAFKLIKCKFGVVSGNNMKTRNTSTDDTVVVSDCEAINLASNTLTNTNSTTPAAVASIQGAAITGVLFSGNVLSGGFHGLWESATATTALAAIGNLWTNIGGGNYLRSTGGGWDLGVSSNTNTDFKNGYG